MAESDLRSRNEPDPIGSPPSRPDECFPGTVGLAAIASDMIAIVDIVTHHVLAGRQDRKKTRLAGTRVPPDRVDYLTGIDLPGNMTCVVDTETVIPRISAALSCADEAGAR